MATSRGPASRRSMVKGASGAEAVVAAEAGEPSDLLSHDCLGYRTQTTGAIYGWELVRGKRLFLVPGRLSSVPRLHRGAPRGVRGEEAAEPDLRGHLL